MKKILTLMICIVLMVVLLTIPAYATSTETVAELSMTEVVVNWIKSHIEELSVIGAVILNMWYQMKKNGKLDLSMGIINNNAIKVAEDSKETIKDALTQMADLALKVEGYKDKFETMIEETRKTVEEKQGLEATLNHVETFLKSAKIATLELSNEVAELLVLANIPNSKKDELYSRHMKAVHELEAAEEVMSNDNGKEA